MYGIRLPPMLSRNGGVPNGCAFRQIHRKVPTVPCLWQEGIRPAVHARSFCRNKRQEEYFLLQRPLRTVSHKFPQEFCQFRTKFLNRPF